jgi:hypothetical protein
MSRTIFFLDLDPSYIMIDGEEEFYVQKLDGLCETGREMDMTDEMTTDRGDWERKTCCADPK